MLQALYLESVTGLSATDELVALMAGCIGQHPDSPNVRDAFTKSLPDTALVMFDDIHYIRGSTMSFQTMSVFGRMLVKALGWPWVESEIDRINRLHQGQRMRRHAAGMVALAHQARRHGWNVVILPDVSVRNVRPDLSIQREGHPPIFIEFESRFRGKGDKWINNFQHQGFAAIFGFTSGSVYGYHRECARLKIPVISGSLQHLIMGDNPSPTLFQWESGRLPLQAMGLVEERNVYGN